MRAGLVVAGLLGLLAGPGLPWTGNQTDLGAPLAWDLAELPLDYVIGDAGSDDIADGSDAVAIGQGFSAWSEVQHSSLAWTRETDPVQTARTDWEADDIRLVLFDEDGSSGLFPLGVGLVAVTVFEFDTGSGALLDADVLFNGAEFSWSTDLSAGSFDVRAAATHEAGHAAGFAHSALGGASMAPFTSPRAFSMRMLSNDDRAAAEVRYPSGLRGQITGSLELHGVPMGGAHVWCRASDGRVASSTLTAADGSFTLSGLDPGVYRVVAAPLDSPLSPADLDALGAPVPNLFFRQSSSGGHVIGGVESLDIGLLQAGDDSAIAVIGPKQLIRLTKGSVTAVTLSVVGVVGGAPTVSVPGSGGISVQNVEFDGGSSLTLEVDVPLAAPSGCFDLELVTSLGTRASMPGFAVLVPPSPTLSLVAAACGGSEGSQEIVVQGSWLGETLEYVFGNEQAVITGMSSGAVGGFPPQLEPGSVDVVVVNAMGDEARLDDAFVFIDGGVPSIGSVFPSAGDVNGGTWVSINGSGFGPVSSVFFNGTPAASLELVSASLLRALTPGLPQGQYDVTVAQSGCANDMWATEFGAFDALQLGPDPTIDSVTPHVLSQGGNELLTITGTGFINSAVVELFNDPGTGDGGTALVTTFVSSTELKAATPAGPLPGGDHALVVRFPGGQADLLPDAVEVDAPTLTGVSPAVMTQTGGVTLSITGTEFTDSAVVELFTDLNDFSGGTPLATTFVSEVELLAEVPLSMAPLPAGLANVVVTMDGPLVAALAGGVQILAPSLDSVTPSQLSPSGDEVLTLTGVGFTPDAVVRLFADEGDLSGGTQLVATVVSDTEISVITPIGPLPGGDATLAIDLTGGLVAADVNGVNVLYPSIAAVAPGQLASTGNEVFTVTGSHFVDGLSIVELFTDAVTLEGGTALATTFVNSTTLTAVTPNGPLPLGNVNVAVRMANDVVALAQGALGFSAALSNGNKASGELGDDDPSDEVVFDGLAGTQVTIIQRRVGKTDLIPKLKLVDPDAAVLVSTDEADPEFDAEQVKLTAKSAMLRKVVLPQTGRYRLLIQRESGAGPYKLSFREKLPLEARRIKLSKPDDVTLGPKQHEIVFDAKAGTRITGTFRGSKKDGLKLVLSSLQDPDGVQLLQTLEDGTVLGAQDLIERVTVGKDQISVRLKQVALPAFGSYRMVWSAGGETSGIVTGRFNLRPPKVKATFEL